ncbi:MAG: hypothetical protein QM503_04485 [Bacteroidota bacterium]
MNKLKSTNHGGMPIELDDLRWMDESYREAFKATIKSLTGEATAGAKLFGCEVVDTEQGDVFTCTEGYVFFNDEIYFVPAHNLVHSDNFLYFKEVITYDPLGDEVFEDANPFGTYEKRTAILESGASQPANTMLYNSKSAATLLGEQINLLNAWQAVAMNAVFVSINNGLSNISGFITYKKLGKTMICIVNLVCDVAASQPVGAKIKIQIPDSSVAKTDQVVATSVIINTSANGETFNKMQAVGAYLEIIDPHEIGITEGNGYSFRGELTFEIN